MLDFSSKTLGPRATWTPSKAFAWTLQGYGTFGAGTGRVDGSGSAAYLHYASNQRRVSLRGENFDDDEGYLAAVRPGVGQKL